MKRYMLFAGMKYYPGGGMADLLGCLDSLDDAKRFFEERNQSDINDWAHVFDAVEEKIVWDYSSGYYD